MSRIPWVSDRYEWTVPLDWNKKKKKCILKLLDLRATDQGFRLIELSWDFIYGLVPLDLPTPTSSSIGGAQVGPTRCLALERGIYVCLRREASLSNWIAWRGCVTCLVGPTCGPLWPSNPVTYHLSLNVILSVAEQQWVEAGQLPWPSSTSSFPRTEEIKNWIS